MKAAMVVQGLHRKPEKYLKIKRTVWLSQDLNSRIRVQHDRLCAAYPSVNKNIHEFLVNMLEASVAKLEEEAAKDNLIVPAGPFKPEEFRELQAKLSRLKDEGK